MVEAKEAKGKGRAAAEEVLPCGQGKAASTAAAATSEILMVLAPEPVQALLLGQRRWWQQLLPRPEEVEVVCQWYPFRLGY